MFGPNSNAVATNSASSTKWEQPRQLLTWMAPSSALPIRAAKVAPNRGNRYRVNRQSDCVAVGPISGQARNWPPRLTEHNEPKTESLAAIGSFAIQKHKRPQLRRRKNIR